MRIAFFGLPIAALLLLRDGRQLVYAAYSRKGAPGTRRLKAALGDTLVDIVPDLSDAGVVARLRATSPDLVVSWFWTKRIPLGVLELAPLGAIGVHPSLLPRHRGPDPYFWTIDAGDEVTGVTAHLLAEEYDTGGVLAQRRLAVAPDWNAWTLARRLDRPSLALLREVVGAYAAGRPPPAVAQDERQATRAPEPDDELLELRWSRKAAEVVRRIRAASPWPGAFTAIGDEVLAILRAKATHDFPRALAPGEAAVRRDGIAVVRTGDDAVELLEGRLEREPDSTLDASALAALVRSLPQTLARA